MASNLRKVPRIYNPEYVRNGPKSYVHLLNKYTFKPTMEGPYFLGNQLSQQGRHGVRRIVGGRAHVQTLLQVKKPDGETGEVTADDQQNDSMYLCPVEIGNPPQKFNLDFDTGSADLWVFSTELPNHMQTTRETKHCIFDSSKSTTFKHTTGSRWKIAYGDNSHASGIVGTDDVSVGGLVINGQTIELAKSLSPEFASGVGDGLLGLAWGVINTVEPERAQTPVESMIAQENITKGMELFTAYLGSWRDADEDDGGRSFYTFGFIDQSVLRAAGVAEPYYTPVDNSEGFWSFASASASVNGHTVHRADNTAIADTGTTLALVDDATCKAVYHAIPGATYDRAQQGWVFPASVTEDQLPVVTLAVGGRQFTIQKEDLGFADAGDGMLYGGIQSRGDMTFDILGDTFLKAIYAIFDVGNKRFGAVQRVEKHQNTATPS